MVSIIIPVYNERRTIAALVSSIKKVMAANKIESEIIVMDDGSTDGSAAVIAQLESIIFLRHPYNLGYGASIKRGIKAARGEIICLIDGDGQHDPADLPRLLMAAQAHPDKLVIGSRLWNRAVIPTARYRANRFANFWIAWASGQAVEDSQSGFRVYPAQLIRLSRFKLSRNQSFVFESEIIIEAARHRFLCAFVPVQTTYPENARPSYFHPVKDIAHITLMVAWHLFIRGFFLPGLWRSLSGNQHLKPRKL